MKKLSFLIISFFSIILLNSCDKPWQPLYNGQNLDNWEKFLGSPLKGMDSLAQLATPDNVFSVVDVNGEKLIRISGEINGSLASIDTFSNFHLQLVYKWGDIIYLKRNSGLLYHSFGKLGVAFGTWMTNIECQLMHERLGDTYLMENTCCEATVTEVDSTWVFSKKGENKIFSKEHNGQLVKKAVDAEKPLGEWNTVDLYCYGRTSVHVVNGQVTTINKNLGKIENGQVIPVSSGKIQLQSEGGELFIKTVQIKPIKEIPKELLQ